MSKASRKPASWEQGIPLLDRADQPAEDRAQRKVHLSHIFHEPGVEALLETEQAIGWIVRTGLALHTPKIVERTSPHAREKRIISHCSRWFGISKRAETMRRGGQRWTIC